jgi:hypothetical protein
MLDFFISYFAIHIVNKEITLVNKYNFLFSRSNTKFLLNRQQTTMVSNQCFKKINTLVFIIILLWFIHCTFVYCRIFFRYVVSLVFLGNMN